MVHVNTLTQVQPSFDAHVKGVLVKQGVSLLAGLSLRPRRDWICTVRLGDLLKDHTIGTDGQKALKMFQAEWSEEREGGEKHQKNPLLVESSVRGGERLKLMKSHQTDLNGETEEGHGVQKYPLVELNAGKGEWKLQKNPLVGHGVEKDKRLNLRRIHQTDLNTGGGGREEVQKTCQIDLATRREREWKHEEFPLLLKPSVGRGERLKLMSHQTDLNKGREEG